VFSAERSWLTRHRALTAAIAMLVSSTVPAADAEEIVFWSNQAQPAEEAKRMREQVLAGFGKPVSYPPQDPGLYSMRIQAEAQAGIGTISMIGGTHGDFVSFADSLIDLSDVARNLNVRTKINPTLLTLGQMGAGEQKYIPWMQAGYVMVANRQALQYLPDGASLDTLTYDQLGSWGKAMREASGGPKIGFPAGANGLLHRFFQGFLYPSYTRSVVTKFRSLEAAAMWSEFRDLWKEVNPRSIQYVAMQEPLLTGGVWVAWDHVARIQDALNGKPADFVVFPPPAGTAGRGFMPVLAGIGVPKTSPNPDDAKALIAYMLEPKTQIATLKATAFFPVVEVELPADLPKGVQMTAPALTAESEARDAIPSLLPVGLGGANERFNKLFTETFRRIVLDGEDIHAVLDRQREKLTALILETQAPCWPPDAPSDGPCPVE
jgi:multiple sugar transport system substrate-binding protein